MVRGKSARAALLAAASMTVGSATQAALVNDWKADTYTSGNWTDSTGGVVATVNGTPQVVNGAFGAHKGINFNANSYFVAPGTGTAPGGSTSWSLVAVYRATAAGAGANNGAFWQGSGLIGDEEPGSPPDFGLALTGTNLTGGGGFNGGDQNASAATTLNTTHSAALVADATAGTLTLFQDGAQVAQVTIPSANFGARDANGFGLGAVTTGGSNPFPGLVAELQTYNSAVNGATLTSSLQATYAAVPEPTSLAFLGVGAMGLMVRRRRRA